MAGPGGFVRADARDLPEIAAKAALHRHRATGARLVTLADGRPDHVFAIAFPTLPDNDTGVAHILEHAVLCGSQRFPLKKPFAHLLRSSLQTYLNASTLPDMTVYPVASRNAADFANLMDVYLDAVFFPTLTEETFLQEGWRLEPDGTGGVTIRGVVYNEMKGMTGVPGHVLEETLRRGLMPDTVYGRAYAGDPEAIVLLDHAELVAFHRRHYVPGEALAFLSGPSVAAAMERLGAVLDRAAGRTCAAPPVPTVAASPAAPRRVSAAYPGARAALRRDGRAAVGWLLDGDVPAERRLAWAVLVRHLTGSPAAPLRRALVDSGLGAELVQCGFVGGRAQPSVQVGLAGMDPARAGDFEAAVLATLADLADGRNEADIPAAIDGADFALREGPVGHAPPGIGRMMIALPELRHGRDPLAALAFAEALADLRRAQAGGARPIAALAARLFDAPARVTAVIEADPDLAARRDERARAWAADLAAGEGGAAIAARVARLRAAQAADDPPEALASIPVLRLRDIPADEPAEPVEIVATAPLVLLQERPTQGIVYLDVALDLGSLPSGWLSEAALLGPALLGTGTAHRDRDGLSRWIAAETGGIRTEAWAATAGDGGAATRLILRGKALADRAEALCAIVAEMLGAPRLDAPERLREVVLAEVSRATSALLPRAHEIVDRRLRAGLGEAGRREEALNGLSRLRHLHRLSLSGDFEALGARLAMMLDVALARPAAVSVTADAASLAGMGQAARSLADTLLRAPADVPHGTGPAAAWPRVEALEADTPVNYVGFGGDLHAAGLVPTGATEAALRHVAGGHLWDAVRERGGAYGVPVRFDPLDGVVTFLSYRDPHLARTIAAFRAAAEFLRQRVSERDLRSSIIAAIGVRDRPLAPGEAGNRALRRHLTGEDQGWRARRRAELLNAGGDDFVRLAEALTAMDERIVAIGGPSALDAMPAGAARSRIT